MKFRTPLEPIRANTKIDLSQSVLSIGSCFAESIGTKLSDNKFDVLVNPFGTIFDTLSITRLLTCSLNNSVPEADSYVLSEGVYKSLHLHSSFSGLSQDELGLQIRARMSITHEFLRTADWLMITFGTAYVYKYNKTSSFIANCQKLPADEFTRELMSMEYLKNDFSGFILKLKKFNSSIKIMLTVSPVRHLRDGLTQNALSKSLLRVLCHDLTSINNSIFYYPAYELMIDDLRDYRFYEQDMIHPSEQAIDYIWNHFSTSFMNNETLSFLEKWHKILLALNHRPFNPSTKEHQQFLLKTLHHLDSMQEMVNVDKEISSIKEQLITT